MPAETDADELMASALSVSTRPDEPLVSGETTTSPVIASAPKENRPAQQEAVTNEPTFSETEIAADVWPNVPAKPEKKSRPKEPKKQVVAQISMFGDDTAAPPPPAG